MTSVLQDWVMELPLRFQGSLNVATRGCDLTPKQPLESHERELVEWIRYCVMNPADPREIDAEPGAFFQSTAPKFKWSEFGHYPLHWVAHVAHALEVIGYCHPDSRIAGTAGAMYRAFAHSMHMLPETAPQQWERLTEDCIANATVVS